MKNNNENKGLKSITAFGSTFAFCARSRPTKMRSRGRWAWRYSTDRFWKISGYIIASVCKYLRCDLMARIRITQNRLAALVTAEDQLARLIYSKKKIGIISPYTIFISYYIYTWSLGENPASAIIHLSLQCVCLVHFFCSGEFRMRLTLGFTCCVLHYKTESSPIL